MNNMRWHKVGHAVFWIACIAAVCSPFTAGCCLIGFGIGSAIDSGPKWDTVATADALSLVKGDDVSVRFLNNLTVEGSFDRYDILSLETYRPLYEESLRSLQSDIILPQIGDSITIVLQSDGIEVQTTFLGLSEQGVIVSAPSVTRSGFVKLQEVRHFELDGGSILEADQLSALLKEGKVACRTGIWVEVENVPERFSFGRIKTIFQLNESNVRYIMGGIGLVIDVVVIKAMSTGDLMIFHD